MLFNYFFKLCYFIYFILVYFPISIYLCLFHSKKDGVFSHVTYFGPNGSQVDLKLFNVRNNLVKFSPSILDVLSSRISLVGAPISRSLNYYKSDLPPGLISLFDLRELTGFPNNNIEESLLSYKNDNSFFYRLNLVFRYCMFYWIFKNSNTIKNNFSLFGIPIKNFSTTDLINYVSYNPCSTFYFINAESINKSFSISSYRKILKNNTTNIIDGAGVSFACRVFGARVRENLNGTDLAPKLLSFIEKRSMSVYFVGAQKDSLESMIKHIKKSNPRLNIVGYNDGYFNDKDKLINSINEANPDFLFVGMGTPVQEVFIDDVASRLNNMHIFAVGGLFDFMSGKNKRAPIWLRECGLEWLYRLYLEPVRLFRRYVLGVPLFLSRILYYKFANHSYCNLSDVSNSNNVSDLQR